MDHMFSGKLLVRIVWAGGHLQFYVCRYGGLMGGGGGWTGGSAGQRDILIYDKWLLLKLSLGAKYVIIISGQVEMGVYMLF